MQINNPFGTNDARLKNIECLLLNLKEQPVLSQPEADELLTIQQVAGFLKLSVPMLCELVSCAAISADKKGKSLHFSKQESPSRVKRGRRKAKRKSQAQKSKPCRRAKRNLTTENHPIEKAKASLVTYKRQNDNTEISGNFNDIKWLIWIDMISAKLWGWIIRALVLVVSKASLLALLWQWLK